MVIVKAHAEMNICRAVLRAFGRSHTYDVRRNTYLWLGAFWGFLVPFFAVTLAMSVERLSVLGVVRAQPGLPGLLACPVLCAVLFGALGTVRHRAQIESERRADAWKELAMKDYLTGLYNRRFVMQELARMLADSRVTGQPVTVILIDLDGFKDVNDSSGHLEGDRVLCQAAQALKGAMRRTDVLGRYGGDEFILLKAADRAAAVRLVNRAIAAVHENTGLALCAGIGCWPQDGTSPEDLIDAADTRLLALKRRSHETKSLARR